MPERNSSLQKKILSLLKTYTLSTREISQELGSTYATTLKHLDILYARSLIENKVYGKTKVWSIKKINPFELDLNSFLYFLIRKNMNQFQNYQNIKDILNKFYLNTIKLNRDKLNNLKSTELIKRYLELEMNRKWNSIEEYDILDENSEKIKIKIYDCKYKFGCCANLFDEKIEILCIISQKFPCLLNFIENQLYIPELIEFSIDPSICVIQLNKSL
ncbi:MAG: winged helix-turn-helix domain-containing protein [Promethearchaeota archaeon]